MGKLKKLSIKRTVILGIFILLGLAYFIIFIYGSYIHVESYGVKEINVQNDNLHFKGYTMSSALTFSGYKYKIKNENVYIRLRYSLPSIFNRDGMSDISIKNNFEGVKNVYLQGREKNDIRLIWSR